MAGLMIAGTHSGSGKTTVTLGIIAALRARGKRIQPFKAGPDFIDPGLAALVASRPARNLDIWMCGRDYVLQTYHRCAAQVDLAIVEGVMGLYDGEASSARLASLLAIPVILVVDAYGLAESAGAVVQGFDRYGAEPGGPPGGQGVVAGVIFNRVASEDHYNRLKGSVRDVPVLGYLPRNEDIAIPERHLGLTVAEEGPITEEWLVKLAAAVVSHIDLDRIVAIAQGTAEKSPTGTPPGPYPPPPKIRIAYGRDRAFSFYYEDNLDLLKEAGAELIPFSPLSAPALPPDILALYLGGGYPELAAEELAANVSLIDEIRRRAEEGLIIYAECGGLIYLSRGIYDGEGRFFPLCGVLPFVTRMKKKRVQLGYREVTLLKDCLLGRRGAKLRGHEYHYSEIVKEDGSEEELVSVYEAANNKGLAQGTKGYQVNHVLASYVHLHFGSLPEAAHSIIKFIKEHQWKTSS